MKLLLVLLVLFISGCSQRVHLISQGYTPEQLSPIVTALEELDLEVKHSDIPLPTNFSDNTIISHPSLATSNQLANIQELLHSLELSPVQLLHFASNHKHYYTQGNIGLYLRHPEHKSRPQPPLYVMSQYCSSGNATLGMQPNGQFLLEVEVYGEKKSIHASSGQWVFDGENLVLTHSQNQVAHFKMQQKTVSTYLGPRRSKVFIPQENHNLPPAFNCEFIIIDMSSAP
ncbi:hypothetical protein [Psychrobium sp. 1_MG-2023]|uniref:hypothetical protein n=1 Tax=Psychrobium sp. 1_MG-2023 TaxID=3062624 RepID=UPI000C34A9D1|nr:hypothetical protein [Psychrobium sp. 1_MG-2023]MDP2561095.1 hypothetical protein [Psychrobium sp. 1_MG-2023]PKF58383.1 hypothetical protein CW748_04275 [Alteromonadales bacterium alter-6D02]